MTCICSDTVIWPDSLPCANSIASIWLLFFNFQNLVFTPTNKRTGRIEVTKFIYVRWHLEKSHHKTNLYMANNFWYIFFSSWNTFTTFSELFCPEKLVRHFVFDIFLKTISHRNNWKRDLCICIIMVLCFRFS